MVDKKMLTMASSWQKKFVNKTLFKVKNYFRYCRLVYIYKHKIDVTVLFNLIKFIFKFPNKLEIMYLYY